MDIEQVAVSGVPNWCFRCNKKKKPTQEGLCPSCMQPMERVTLGSTANIEGRISIAILAIVTGIAFYYERTHDSSDIKQQISTLVLLIGLFLLFGLLSMCSFPSPGRDLLVRTVPVEHHPIYERKFFSLSRFCGEMAKMFGVGLIGGIIIILVILVIFLFRVLIYFVLRVFLEFLRSIH